MGNKVTLFFDLDGTLYSYKDGHSKGLNGAFVYWQDITGDNFKQFMKKYNKSRQNVKRYLKGTVASHSRALYFQGMVEENFQTSLPYHIAELTQRYWDTFIEHIEPFDGVKRTLDTLKKDEYKLGIITNMSSEIQLRKLHQLELDNYFDLIITSEEAGQEKPHPHIYLHAVNKLDINPEQSVMIGDNWEHDVEAAEYIGMKAILITIEDDQKELDATKMSSFDELPDILSNLNEEPIEGVIKYKLSHYKSDYHFSLNQFEGLINLRDKLWELDLIGVYPESHYATPGVGYGNVSQRYTDDGQFIISGTQTGEIKQTQVDEFSLVVHYSIEENHVVSKGPIKPSSESMTHAAIYAIAPEVNFVIHVHNNEFWKNYKELGLNTTSKEVKYGTPEMAYEIQQIYNKNSILDKPIAMLGHEDGLLSWGETKEEALKLFLDLIDVKNE